MSRMRPWLFFICALLIVGGARAQAGYPSKPITVIVPITPGGVTDRMARVFATGIGKSLGQSVVVVNRGGANGTLGANAVAKATPDGYTLCFCNSAPVTLAKFTVESMPYDMDHAFAPVTRVYDLSPIIAVPPNSPHSSLGDLLKAAKAKPGMTFGHTGAGGALHLGFELVLDEARTDMTAVAYPGESPMLPDLATGRLDAGVISAQFAKAQASAGNLKILASMGAPSPMLGVPTVAELGFPGFHATSWSGFLLPAGTPAPIVQQLNAAIQKVASDPEIHASLVAAGLTPVIGQTPEQFQAFIEKEKQNWAKVVKKIGGIKK